MKNKNHHILHITLSANYILETHNEKIACLYIHYKIMTKDKTELKRCLYINPVPQKAVEEKLQTE